MFNLFKLPYRKPIPQQAFDNYSSILWSQAVSNNFIGNTTLIEVPTTIFGTNTNVLSRSMPTHVRSNAISISKSPKLLQWIRKDFGTTLRLQSKTSCKLSISNLSIFDRYSCETRQHFSLCKKEKVNKFQTKQYQLREPTSINDSLVQRVGSIQRDLNRWVDWIVCFGDSLKWFAEMVRAPDPTRCHGWRMGARNWMRLILFNGWNKWRHRMVRLSAVIIEWCSWMLWFSDWLNGLNTRFYLVERFERVFRFCVWMSYS